MTTQEQIFSVERGARNAYAETQIWRKYLDAFREAGLDELAELFDAERRFFRQYGELARDKRADYGENY